MLSNVSLSGTNKWLSISNASKELTRDLGCYVCHLGISDTNEQMNDCLFPI